MSAANDGAASEEVSENSTGPAESREAPRALKLLGLVIAAWLLPQIVAVFAVPGIAEGSTYESVENIFQLSIIPDAGTALIAIWAIRRYGMMDAARHERYPVNRWVWAVPIAMLATSVAATDYANLIDAGVGFVMLLAVGTMFTGLSEELLFRGFVLTSLRTRRPEWQAAWLSSAFFGLFHLVNIVTAGPSAVFQAVWAIIAGYLLYLCRRAGGGLLLPIVVHWVWDFASFSPYLRDPDALAGGRNFILFAVTIVLVIVVVIKRRSIPHDPDARTGVADADERSA